MYAAGVLGVLFLVLVLSATLFLNVCRPGLLDLRSAAFSRLGLVLIWAVATVISYALLVPHGRYRKWSEEFTNRHAIVREKPALVEVTAVGAVLLLLVMSIVLNWIASLSAS